MFYTIAQVAEKFGLTAHTLRYYDKEGLLRFVDRTSCGARRFKDEDFEWLAVITCLKDTGMQVKDIKTYIDWCFEGDCTIEQRLEMFCKQKEKVNAQIKELKRHLKKIEYKIWYYEEAKKAGTLSIHKNIDNECIKEEIERIQNSKKKR